jgi:5-(carboxyamino)imidazole ribonucleotide synthase
MSKPIEKSIGIVGGGQLGKMLVESAQKWNVRFNILDAKGSPAARYAEAFIEGSLTDVDRIKELASVSDIITYEIEHIDAEALLQLSKEGKRIVPSPEILLTIQDKGKQKDFYKELGLPTTKYILLDVNDIDLRKEDIEKLSGNRLVVKSCTGGYDGKGVLIIERELISKKHLSAQFKGRILIEECVENGKELSVIVARDDAGHVVTYPVVEMVFDPSKNLVDYLFAPARVSKIIEEEARRISIEAVKHLDGVGLFAVELFLDDQENLFINEIAPRPHNSGHHTIEACNTSQYEQLVRILLEYPLGNTSLHSPVVMTNIIGPPELSGDYKLIGHEDLLKVPGASLHWYNKIETRPGRKMGHFTVLNSSLEKAIDQAHLIQDKLKIVPV